MNITELARILRITPQELRNCLPQLGFDIGQKAIKINKSVANKIVRDWPLLKKKLDALRFAEEKKNEVFKLDPSIETTIHVPALITVRDFATITSVPVSTILGQLMKNGIFASLNEKIDFDTAWLVGSALGFDVKKQETENKEEEEPEADKLQEVLENEKLDAMITRAPVVVVMGHVDHGKTKLLDTVRETNVAAGETGGITQHIGAYQVKHKENTLTFIDTPGHEAFTAMRSRGAKIADLAILVVAADDGVKPQTIEAFKIIEAAKIPYIVAINKIDKEAANIEKTKQELSNKLGIVPEDWGGKVICSPISALKEKGIKELLDMLLLVAETEEDNIKANPKASAIGTIIESNISKGAGPVATILVQNGTLRVGDSLMFNGINVGKVRNLNDYKEDTLQEAGPSTPVQIIGLKTMPQVGDILQVGEGQRVKHQKIGRTSTQSTNINIAAPEDDKDMTKLNIIIKSDVYGSAEAIEESLEKINTEDVKVKIVHKGLGNITDGNIKQAEASDAIILAFNVSTSPTMANLARERRVKIKSFSIIYDLIEDVRAEMQAIVKSTMIRKDLGRLKVLAVFRTEKESQIVGGKVLDGEIESESIIEVFRDKELIAEGALTKLQAGKQDVTMVEQDQECGIEYTGSPVIEEGDILQFYKEEEVIKKV